MRWQTKDSRKFLPVFKCGQANLIRGFQTLWSTMHPKCHEVIRTEPRSPGVHAVVYSR